MAEEKKYVVLEHLCLPNRGFRFWTTNTENNTHSQNGELWYKEILFTDNEKEAIEASRLTGGNLPTYSELEEYHREEFEKEKKLSDFNKLGKDEGEGSYCCGKRMILAQSGICYECLSCGGWEYSSS